VKHKGGREDRNISYQRYTFGIHEDEMVVKLLSEDASR
jgi:hypothetical protein